MSVHDTTTYYLLPTTYYLLPTTNYLPRKQIQTKPGHYYLLPTTYYLLPTTYHEDYGHAFVTFALASFVSVFAGTMPDTQEAEANACQLLNAYTTNFASP